MSDINDRNFAAIQQALNTLNRKVDDQNKTIVQLQNTIAVMQQELASQKAVTAAVLGTGMGSTVR